MNTINRRVPFGKKAVFFLLLSVLTLGCFTARAAVLTLPEGLTEIGEQAFYGDTSLDEVVVPESARRIGPYAFAASSVRKVYLPDTMESIADSAFDSCPDVILYVRRDTWAHEWCRDHAVPYTLTDAFPEGVQYTRDENGYVITGYTGSGTSMILPDSVDGTPVYSIASGAFQNKALTRIHLPDGLKSIGSWAFYNNSGLTELTIPDGIESVGSYAFCGCSSLTAVTMPVDIENYYNVFDSSVSQVQTIHYTPGKTGVMPDKQYSDEYSDEYDEDYQNYLESYSGETLTSVILDEGIIRIGDYAFYECPVLASVLLPESLKTIGIDAFSGDAGLTQIELPDGLEDIGPRAFAYTGLRSLVIPGSITEIKGGFCYECTSLCTLTFPDTLKEIGDSAFYNNSGLTELTIPDGIESVGSYAFGSCSGLTTVTMPVDRNYHSVFSSGVSHVQTIHYTPGRTGVMPDKAGSSGLECYSRETLTSVILDEGIIRIGDYAFYNCRVLASVPLPDSLKTIGAAAFAGDAGLTQIELPDGLESIGESAFSSTGLRSLVIPGSVTVIDRYLCNNCVSLCSVTFPDTLKEIGYSAFYNNSGLTELTIPDGIESVGSYAFCGCSSLTAVTMPVDIENYYNVFDSSVSQVQTIHYTPGKTGVMPDKQYSDEYSDEYDEDYQNYLEFYSGETLTSVILDEGIIHIGDYAFYECPVLDTVSLPDSLKTIGIDAFSGDAGLIQIELPDGLESIGEYAFSSTGLRSLVIPGSVTVIEYHLCNYCTSLCSVTFPDTLKTIGQGAFYNNSSLTELSIPDGIEGIGSGAFYGNSSLTELSIPDGIEGIGSGAFGGCSGLTAVTMPVDIGNYNTVFDSSVSHVQTIHYTPGRTGVMPNKTYSSGLEYYSRETLTSVILDEGIIRIGNYAFYNCPVLDTVSLPDSLKTIGVAAFSGDAGLTQIELPDSLESIGESAFSSTGLRSLVIPGSVTVIDRYLCNNCVSLCSVTFPDTLKEIGDSAFYNNSGLTELTIPDGIESVGSYAFCGCSSLTAVTMPVDIENYYNVFDSSVSQVQTIHYTPGKTGVMPDKQYSDEYSDEYDEDYQNYLEFYSGETLTSVILDEGIIRIGNYAFYNCSALAAVSLPRTLRSIGTDAFAGCDGLQDLVLPIGCEYSGIPASQALQAINATNVIKSVWSPVSDTEDIFNIYFDPFDGDITYSLEMSSSLAGPFTQACVGSTVYLACKRLTYGVPKGETVYFRIRGDAQITQAFDPREYDLGYEYVTTDLFKIGITGVYADSGLTEIEIPDKIGIRQVTGVDVNALSLYPDLRLISLPESAAAYRNALAQAYPDCAVIVRNDNGFLLVPPSIDIILQEDNTTVHCIVPAPDAPDGVVCTYTLLKSASLDGDYAAVSSSLQECTEFTTRAISNYHFKTISCSIAEGEEAYFKVKKTVTAGSDTHTLYSDTLRVCYQNRVNQFTMTGTVLSDRGVEICVTGCPNDTGYVIGRTENGHCIFSSVQWDWSEGFRYHYVSRGNSTFRIWDAMPSASNTFAAYEVYTANNDSMVVYKGNRWGEISVFTMPAPILSAERQGDGAVISWEKPEGAESYEVYMSVDGGPYEQIAGDVQGIIYSVPVPDGASMLSFRVRGFRKIWNKAYYGAFGECSMECGESAGVVRKLSLYQVYYQSDPILPSLGSEEYLSSALALGTPDGLPLVRNSVYVDLGKEEIRRKIKSELVDRAGDHDVSILFISAHGKSGNVSDDHAGSLVLANENEEITFVELAGMLEGIKGKVIIILGSCGAGSSIGEIYGGGNTSFAPLKKENYYVLCGASGGTKGKITSNSYTYYGYNKIAEYIYESALHGDRDGDGTVTMWEMGDYVAYCAFMEFNDPSSTSGKYTEYSPHESDYALLVLK